MDNYDYHYQYYDDYQHSNHLPSMVRTKSGKENRIKQRKHRHKVGEHIVKTIKEENGSPTSGQITVVVVPESTFKEESRQQDRNTLNNLRTNASADVLPTLQIDRSLNKFQDIPLSYISARK